MSAQGSMSSQFRGVLHHVSGFKPEFFLHNQPMLHMGDESTAMDILTKRKNRGLPAEHFTFEVDAPLHNKVFTDGAVNTAQFYRHRQLGLDVSPNIERSFEKFGRDHDPADRLEVLKAIDSGMIVQYQNKLEPGRTFVVPTTLLRGQ